MMVNPMDFLLPMSPDIVELEKVILGLKINHKSGEVKPHVEVGRQSDLLTLNIDQKATSKSHFDFLPDRIIYLKEVCMLTALCRTAIYDKSNKNHKNYDPTFPKQKKAERLGRRARWSYNEIIAWINGLK
jgi:predicted DNA-binding transcriptional regulator AlpA